jgi:uracil-DNA glycosylase
MFGQVNLVEEGRPFVGNVGKLLDEVLEEAGIDPRSST